MIAPLRLLQRVTVVRVCATDAVRIDLVACVVAHARLALPGQAFSCRLIGEVAVFHVVLDHRVARLQICLRKLNVGGLV